MNIIACLVKEPTKPAKFAIVDTDNAEEIAEIISAKNLDVDVVCDVCAVIHDAIPEKNHKTYNCSIQGEHFYGAIIIAGITGANLRGTNLHDIILTPGFIEKYIPAEDKYERTV